MQELNGLVAVVTGASRGIGRGVANELASLGAKVYATGRSVNTAELLPAVIRVPIDHTNDLAVSEFFEQVASEQERIDILVNNAWPGYERMVENGQFTWPLPFWEQPTWRWEAMINGGVRSAFVSSQHAARLMITSSSGLIVNLSYWAAVKHMGNAIYGISKAATDKFTSDAAFELRPHNVAVVSLYPGLVRTEAVLAAGVFDLSNSESPEFIGRAVAAMATDPDIMRKSGTVVVAATLAKEYNFADISGKQPRPLTLAEAI